MKPQGLPTGAEQITVTATAKNILELIRTAASNAGFVFDPQVNGVILTPEGGVIRYSFSFTPTGVKGMLLNNGVGVRLDTIPENIELIRKSTESSDVTVNIQVFQARTMI